jgi:hypothetical protein
MPRANGSGLLLVVFAMAALLAPHHVAANVAPSTAPTPTITVAPSTLAPTSPPTLATTATPTTSRPTTPAPNTNPTCSAVCGCGVSPVDADGDGTPDCRDGCPLDFNKLSPGMCGCGVSDTLVDLNHDGHPVCSNGKAPLQISLAAERAVSGVVAAAAVTAYALAV